MPSSKGPWPRAQDASISTDGSLRLRKGKAEMLLSADEVTGLFDLLMLKLPDGPRRDRAKRSRRFRLAHEAALLMAGRVADLAHQTLQLLDQRFEEAESEAPGPLVSVPPDSSPRPSEDIPHDRSVEETFVPQVRAR